MADIGRGAVAEAIGTFALVFVGGGAIAAWTAGYFGPGPTDIVAIALAHGLTIAALVTALGHVSGGQFNPAVTFGLLVGRRIDPKTALVYGLSQLIGAALAGIILVTIFTKAQVASATPDLNAGSETLQAVSSTTGIIIEAILTFFLVFVVFGTIDKRNSARIGGLAIGLTVTLDILMGGPLTGAAMNPARWFGTAVASSHYANWFVYWIGPLVGGLLAGVLYGYYFDPNEPDAVEKARATGKA
ncbi:MAG TPA: MIP family channel protein [Candidatus Thermoplasmatota archaeon]|nr:MIP family channel protein [Candidatus Thermoplasmatota archaeon]